MKSAYPASSVLCLAPLNFRREVSRLVSCYALFKGWLLLSQPPRCLWNFTSLSTEQRFRGLRWWFGLFPFWDPTLAPDFWLPWYGTREFGVWLKILRRTADSHSVALPPATNFRTLALKLFRREPAIAELDWNFSPTHKSSPSIVRLVGAGLLPMLLGIHPAHM